MLAEFYFFLLSISVSFLVVLVVSVLAVLIRPFTDKKKRITIDILIALIIACQIVHLVVWCQYF